MVDCLHSLQSKYQHDRFAAILRPAQPGAVPGAPREWRIKCYDCPGKASPFRHLPNSFANSVAPLGVHSRTRRDVAELRGSPQKSEAQAARTGKTSEGEDFAAFLIPVAFVLYSCLSCFSCYRRDQRFQLCLSFMLLDPRIISVFLRIWTVFYSKSACGLNRYIHEKRQVNCALDFKTGDQVITENRVRPSLRY